MATKPDSGRSSMEDSPPSGEEELVEPDQGNGTNPHGLPGHTPTDTMIQFFHISFPSCGPVLI